MHKNYFDIVMAHIEENVDKPTKEIKKEIPNLIHRHGRAFKEHFYILTDYTLDSSIKQRRLNYAARDLVLCKDKSVGEIAAKYQFPINLRLTVRSKQNTTLRQAKYGKTNSCPMKRDSALSQLWDKRLIRK